MIITGIRYIPIRKKVNNIYLNKGITSMPVNMIDLIKSYKMIKICKYSELIKRFGIDNLKDCSDEGFSGYDPESKRYLIYYNDIEKSEARIRWTLAHELGHIFLKHHFLHDGSVIKTLTEYQYQFREQEANLFASWLLAHPVILSNLDITCADDLITFCNLSHAASEIRFNRFCKWEQNKILVDTDYKILENFKGYIEDKHEDYLIQQRLINTLGLAY